MLLPERIRMAVFNTQKEKSQNECQIGHVIFYTF